MNWAGVKTPFAYRQGYPIAQDAVPNADILPSREKRRASPTVNLCLYIAEKLQQQSSLDADKLRSVFASSDGDMDIFHYLSNELSKPEPAISPTLFHQSLHNSAAGYWHIVTNSKQASVSISAGNDTFCGGLLTAIIDVCTGNMPVLFVAYNVTSPPPLAALNPILTWFGVGFIFTQEKNVNTIAKITCSLVNRQDETSLSSPSLNSLHLNNPIARCLPLLEHIANKVNEPVYLNYLDKHSLEIEMEEYIL
jgi:hypothetical protein